MKLRQIVIDESTLTLTKERKQKKFGEVFDVSDERGAEILATTFKGYPVAEIVVEEPKTTKILNTSSFTLADDTLVTDLLNGKTTTYKKNKSKGGKK